jgi:hypothetical protein
MKAIRIIMSIVILSLMLLIPHLILAQNDIDISPTYSATWEMEYSTGIICEADTEFDSLLSSSGSFQVGHNPKECNAWLRGVLEFDLSTVPVGIQSIQLSFTRKNCDVSGGYTMELDGFSGNGTPDQADPNVDNFLMSFSTPEPSETVILDVTSFVESLLNTGATHAGFTISRHWVSSNFVTFDGVGDLSEPLLTFVVNAPVANAGIDQMVFDEITLDGSLSDDTDGTIESYEWQLTHRGNSANDRTAQTANPTVSNLAPGFYDVTLTVTDNHGYTDTDEMLFTAIGLKGDLDLDGDIDGFDLSEFAEAFGTLY